MAEENKTEEIDLDAIINDMSSINSEDYWFTKVSKIEEIIPQGGTAPLDPQGKSSAL
ncbi:MAG: hypothetical protein HUK20_08625 [Fibrobacter sp.]|nr:hypothetical protein [Fibrobacter sp.]